MILSKKKFIFTYYYKFNEQKNIIINNIISHNF